MDRAYEVSIRALREKMRRDNPMEERQLQEISQTDVIVVRGQYDRVQDVLGAMDIPFTLVSAAHLPDQLSPSWFSLTARASLAARALGKFTIS
jgi:hypothetical protein